MYIGLRCSVCGDSEPVSFAALYDIWVRGYEELEPEGRPESTPFTEVTCHCGHTERFEDPMFKYVFCLIYDEFVKEKTA